MVDGQRYLDGFRVTRPDLNHSGGAVQGFVAGVSLLADGRLVIRWLPMIFACLGVGGGKELGPLGGGDCGHGWRGLGDVSSGVATAVDQVVCAEVCSDVQGSAPRGVRWCRSGRAGGADGDSYLDCALGFGGGHPATLENLAAPRDVGQVWCGTGLRYAGGVRRVARHRGTARTGLPRRRTRKPVQRQRQAAVDSQTVVGTVVPDRPDCTDQCAYCFQWRDGSMQVEQGEQFACSGHFFGLRANHYWFDGQCGAAGQTTGQALCVLSVVLRTPERLPFETHDRTTVCRCSPYGRPSPERRRQDADVRGAEQLQDCQLEQGATARPQALPDLGSRASRSLRHCPQELGARRNVVDYQDQRGGQSGVHRVLRGQVRDRVKSTDKIPGVQGFRIGLGPAQPREWLCSRDSARVPARTSLLIAAARAMSSRRPERRVAIKQASQHVPSPDWETSRDTVSFVAECRKQGHAPVAKADGSSRAALQWVHYGKANASEKTVAL
jgi:hypothetical protein